MIGTMTVLTVLGMSGWLAIAQGEGTGASIVWFVGLCIGGLIALLSVPGIIAGWGLLAGQSWARILMIVLGALDLLNFPIGTALGIYTLWALLGNPSRVQVT